MRGESRQGWGQSCSRPDPKAGWRRAICYPKCGDEGGNSEKHSRTAFNFSRAFSLRGCTTSLGDFDRDFGRACGPPPTHMPLAFESSAGSKRTCKSNTARSLPEFLTRTHVLCSLAVTCKGSEKSPPEICILRHCLPFPQMITHENKNFGSFSSILKSSWHIVCTQ